MKKITKVMLEKWYLVVIGAVLFVQAAVFLICGEDSYIAVHDNLDLFVSHFKMLKDDNIFFAQGADMPMLGGISRDNFASEFSLYNMFYMVLPTFWAYIVGYFAKIIIGMWSFMLLCKDVYKEKYETYKPLVAIIALAFGLIPVFPAYGIAFTSVPLIVYLLRRIYIQPKPWLFVAVFCYPFLSYFSYLGFFILAYLVCGIFIMWIKDKKFPKWLALSLPVLAAGYVCFEYRLFRIMLFSDSVTIRSSIVANDWSFSEIIGQIFSVFLNPVFHAQDSHFYVVLPVCMVGLVVLNLNYIKKKNTKAIWKDGCNGVFLFIVFNCIVAGIYGWKLFRDIFEMLIPVLTGFQFDRTVYFNTFLWYALLFLLLKKLYDTNYKKWLWFANLVAVIALCIVMFKPQVYNDFYYTCYNMAYKMIKQQETFTVNYREFYAEELFDEIKEELDYTDEWSVAYGMHPAVLHYNGIHTLDGYLGFYTQEYKEKFREVIAPALETSEEFRDYFDSWGPRAYIYSGAGENTYEPVRYMELTDKNLSINSAALKDMGCKYIFSRIEVENAEDLQLKHVGTYEKDNLPYVIYVYEL